MKKIVSALAIFVIAGAMGCGLLLINMGKDGGSKTTVQAAAPIMGTGEHAGWWLIPDYDTLNHATTRTLMGQSGNRFKITHNIQIPANGNWTPIPLLAAGNTLDGLPLGYSVPWEAYIIDGLRITSAGNKGLFDNMLGTVRNITFTNVNVPTAQSGSTNHGVVAARVSGSTVGNVGKPINIGLNSGGIYQLPNNYALIENVTVESGVLRGTTVGGIVGSVSNGASLTLAYAHNFADVLGQNICGGLIGEINNARVHVTYSMCGSTDVNAAVNGNTGVAGGIVARVQGGSTVTMDTAYNRGRITTSQGNGTQAGGIVGGVIGTNTIVLAWTGSTGIIGHNTGHMQGIYGVGPPSVHHDAGCFYDITGLPAKCDGGEGGMSTEEAKPLGAALEQEIRRIAQHEITILQHSAAIDGYTLAPVAANATNKVWSGERYTFTVTLEAAYSDADFKVRVADTANVNVGYVLLSKADAVSRNGNIYTFTTAPIWFNKTIGIWTGLEGGMKKNTYTISTTNTSAPNNPVSPNQSEPFWFVGSTTLPTPKVDHEHGDPYTFQVQVGPQYNQAARIPTVRANSTTLTGTRSGDVFTYTIPSITVDTVISVTPQSNIYTVTVPTGTAALGYTVPSGSGTYNIQYGGSHSFSVNFLDSHTNYSVLANGAPLTKVGGGNLTAGTNNFNITSISQNVTVTISATLKTYTVSTATPDKNTNPNAGFTFLTEFNGVSINHGANFSFSFQVDAAYSNVNPNVTITGDVTGAISYGTPQKSGNMWTYTVTNVTQNLSISVSTQINTYSISFVRSAGTEIAGVTLPPNLTNISHGVHSNLTFQITLADSHSDTNIANLLSVSSTFAQYQGRNGNIITYQIIGSVESNTTITVTATRNIYNINVSSTGTGISNITSIPTVNYGSEYTFTFNLAESHQLNPFQVTSASSYNIEYVSGNTYRIVNTGITPHASDIRHNISITISATIKVYTITFIGGDGTKGFTYGDVGQSGVGITTRQHGQSIDVIVILAEGRSNAAFIVYVNNGTSTTQIQRSQFSQNGRTFTYTLTVTTNLTIAVGDGSGGGPGGDLEWDKYTVDLQKTGTGFTAQRVGSFVPADEGIVWHNDVNYYTFEITFNSGYGMSPTPPTITIIGGTYQAVLVSAAGTVAQYRISTLIRHNIQIKIVAFISTHTVTLNSANNTRYTTPTAFPTEVGHLQSFTFVILTGEGYNSRAPLISFNVGGITASLANQSMGVYTFKIDRVSTSFEITVQPRITAYPVAVPLFGPTNIVRDPNTTAATSIDADGVPATGTNYHSFIALGEKEVDHGEMNYELTVRVHEHYNIYSTLVTVSGGLLKDDQITGTSDVRINLAARTITYTICNVSGPLSFEVTVNLTVYGVRYWINEVQTTSADGVTAIGPQTIKLGDSFEFDLMLAQSHIWPEINPFRVSSGNATLTMPPNGFRDMSRFTLEFDDQAGPGIYYTGGIVDIKINSEIKKFNLRYTIPAAGIDSYNVKLEDNTSLAAGSLHEGIEWGTNVIFTVTPTSQYEITHIVINGLPVFLNLEPGLQATYDIELYEDTEISFLVSQGKSNRHAVSFLEDGGTITNTKFKIIGDANVMDRSDYTFSVELNRFHSKAGYANSGFQILITRAGDSSGSVQMNSNMAVNYQQYIQGKTNSLQFKILDAQSDLVFDICNVIPNTHTIEIYGLPVGGPYGFTVSNELPANKRVTTVNSEGVFKFTVTLDYGYRLTPPTISVKDWNGVTAGELTYTHTSGSLVYNYTVNGIMSDIGIDISATPDIYNVSLAAGNASTLGWVAEAVDSSLASHPNYPMAVKANGWFQFNIIVEPSHSQFAPVVNIPGIVRSQPVPVGSSGRMRYLFTVSEINEHLNITASLIDVRINTYSVTFEAPANRFTYKYVNNANGQSNILDTNSLTRNHGELLMFSIELAEGWTQSISTLQIYDNKTNEILAHNISGTKLSFALSVTADMDLRVWYGTLNRNRYDVYFPALGAQVGYQVDGDSSATFGLAYTFTLNLSDSHNFVNDGVVVSINGEEVDFVVSGTYNNLYTISGEDILGDIIITVSVDIKRYDINIVNTIGSENSHFTANAPASIKHNENLVFSITMKTSVPYYLRAPEARIGGQLLTPISSSGTTYNYSVLWATVIANMDTGSGSNAGELTVDITPLINQYVITMPYGEGFVATYDGKTTTSSQNLSHLVNDGQTSNFTFTITVNASHNKSTPRVMVAGEQILHITGSAPSNTVYTFTIPADMLTSNLTIAVFDVEFNKYTVSLPATGPGFTTEGSNSIVHLADNSHKYEFKVIMLGSHDLQAIPFTVTGNLVPVLKEGTSDTYVISGISSDITITVNTSVKIYNVTLDTNCGEGFVFESGLVLPTTREHGEEISFTINLGAKSHHLVQPKLFINSIETMLQRIGNTNRYSYSTAVTSDIKILIQTFINEYTVVFPDGDGFIAAGINGATGTDKITHGNGYRFIVELLNSHNNENPKVWVNGNSLVLPNRELDGRTFIFALTFDTILSLIDNDGLLKVEVEAKRNSYTITLTPPQTEERWSIGSDMTTQALHGSTFTFWVQLDGLQQSLGMAPAIELTYANGAPVTQTASQVGQAVNGQYTFAIANITNTVTVHVKLATIYKAYFLANFQGSDPAFDQQISGTEGQVRENTLGAIYRPGYEITKWIAKDAYGTIISTLESDWTHFTMPVPGSDITYRAEWGYKTYTLDATNSSLLITPAQTTVRIGENNNISIPNPVFDQLNGGMISWEAYIPGSNTTERFASSTGRTIDLIDYVTSDFLDKYADPTNGYIIKIKAVHVQGTTYTITAQITDGDYGNVELEYEIDNSKRILNNRINTITIGEDEVVHFNLFPHNDYFQAEISMYENGAWTQWQLQDTLEFNSSGKSSDWAPVFRIRFVSKNFAVNFSFASDYNEAMPQNVVVQGIEQQYQFQLDSKTGTFLLTVAVENPNDIQTDGFGFVEYTITSGEAGWQHFESLLMLTIDSAFLDKYLDVGTGSVEITAQFLPIRKVEVEYLGTPPSNTTSFEVYTVTGYDIVKDENILLKAPNNAVNSFPVSTRVAIAVRTGGNFAPKINHPLMTDQAELLGGIYYFYFTVPHNYSVWDEVLEEYVLKEELLFQIGFESTAYKIAIERRVGADVYSTETLKEEIAGNKSQNVTVVVDSPFPGINFANTKQPATVEYQGNTYYFTGWYFKTIDERLLPAIVDEHVDESGNVMSTFIVNNTFFETYVGALGSTDTITLVAMYGNKAILRVNIANGMGIAGAEVYINNTAPFTVFTNSSIEMDIGDEVLIKPIYNPLSFNSNITSPITYTVSGTRTVLFEFSAKTHDFSFTATSKSKNGKLNVQVNAKTVSSPGNFTYGDVLTFCFDTDSFHTLKKLYVTNGTNRMQIKNGQPIIVNDEWLETWVVNGELNLDFELNAKVALKPIVVICIALTAILVPLILYFIIHNIISGKKKKEEYLHALEGQKHQAKGGL